MVMLAANRLTWKNRLVMAAMLCAWVAAAVLLLGAAWSRGTAEGERGAAPARWPSDTGLVLAADRPTVVLFAHPRCPCTHATLSELARALASVESVESVEPPHVQVRLFLPEGTDPTWAHTGLWSRAEELLRADVDVDAGGAEAARFDARTSGLVLAYAPDGRRLFAGGVTAARGHEGNNAGRDALVAALRDDVAARAAVYGCAL
jgi:hypothetical protein